MRCSQILSQKMLFISHCKKLLIVLIVAKKKAQIITIYKSLYWSPGTVLYNLYILLMYKLIMLSVIFLIQMCLKN